MGNAFIKKSNLILDFLILVVLIFSFIVTENFNVFILNFLFIILTFVCFDQYEKVVVKFSFLTLYFLMNLYLVIQLNYNSSFFIGGLFSDDSNFYYQILNLLKNYTVNYLWNPIEINLSGFSLFGFVYNTGYVYLYGSILFLLNSITSQFSYYDIFFINILISTFFIMYSYRIIKVLTQSIRKAMIGSLLILIYPSFSFFSIVILRDVFAAFLILGYFYYLYYSKSKYKKVFVLIFVILLLYTRMSIGLSIMTISMVFYSFNLFFKRSSKSLKSLIFIALGFLLLFIFNVLYFYFLPGYLSEVTKADGYGNNSILYVIFSLFFSPFPVFRPFYYWGGDSNIYLVWSSLGAFYFHLLLPFVFIGFYQKIRDRRYLLVNIWFVLFVIVFIVSSFIDERRRLMMLLPMILYVLNVKINRINNLYIVIPFYSLYLLLNFYYLLS